MGLLIRGKDNLHKKFFKEMAKLLGIEVKYRYFIDNSKHYTIHAEQRGKLSEPVDIDIIFQEYPDQKTLRQHGWFSENPDDKAYVAQVPSDLIGLQRGCYIDIPYGAKKDTYRTFRITDISSIIVHPESYYVRLAPEFDTIVHEVDHNYSDTSFNFIDFTEED